VSGEENRPSAETTLAVILGVSRCPLSPQLSHLEASANTAHNFYDYLTGDFGLPEENVKDLFNSVKSPSGQLQEIGEWSKSKGMLLRDLIVFYSGHASFTPRDRAFFLAVRTTKEYVEGATSIRMVDLAQELSIWASFARKYLILDCCFAGSAAPYFTMGSAASVAVAQIKEVFPPKGTAILCSSSAKEVSIAIPGQQYTRFGEALFDVLREGNHRVPTDLSLEDVGTHVREKILEKYPAERMRPEVQSPDQSEGDVAKVRLFPNPATRIQETRRLAAEQRQKDQLATVEKELGRPVLLVDTPELAVCKGAAIHGTRTSEPLSISLPPAEVKPRLLYVLEAAFVSGLAFAPSGALLASGSWDEVRLWRVADGALVQMLKLHEQHASWDTNKMIKDGLPPIVEALPCLDLPRISNPSAPEGHGINAVAFSPDGTLLASGGPDAVQLWRVTDGKHLRTLKGHRNVVNSVAFSPDGAMLASGSWDGTVRLWGVEDGKPTCALKRFSLKRFLWASMGALSENIGGENLVSSVAFSPADGTLLASGYSDGAVWLWRTSDGKLLSKLKGGDAWGAGRLAFSPEGRMLLHFSNDGTIQLWQVVDGTLLQKKLEGQPLEKYTHNAFLWTILSPDSMVALVTSDETLVASGNVDGDVWLWRVVDGAVLQTLEGHTDWVTSVAFSPDGAMLASGSKDTTVRLWSLK
jgi:WD40 repeat protein